MRFYSYFLFTTHSIYHDAIVSTDLTNNNSQLNILN